MVSELVTGEAVVLDVPCARFPSRAIALLIDLTIQVAALFILLVTVAAAAARGGLDAASGAAVTVTALVLAVVGYPVIWETLSRGRSPGKLALGLRVVSDDGGPERFRQALVRGLAAAVEIWGLLGCPALICSLISVRGKRLGDVFAGTFVIQQRLPPARRVAAGAPVVVPELAQWAVSLEMSRLTDHTAETARRYLARMPELTPDARLHLGEQIAAAVGTQVSPPPPPRTPVAAFLGAVLAERARRDHARLSLAGAPAAPGGPGAPAAPAAPGGPGTLGVPGGPGSDPAARADSEPWPTPGRSAQGQPLMSPPAESGRVPGSAQSPGGFVPPA